DVVIVRILQGCDIALAQRAGVAQTLASPGKPRTSKPHDQKVGHEAGVAAIAVGESVNLHQTVMEAHCDLVGRICLVFDAGLGVVEQLAQGYGNLVEGNAEIAFTCPELSGPAPRPSR